MKKDFLTLAHCTAAEIEGLLDLAALYKRERRRHPKPLAGKILGMIFEKSSTRTRVSFEVAMLELGGMAIALDSHGTQLGRGESYADTARVLSRYLDFLCVRTFAHERLEELARFSTIPVINALTDLCHPCQVLADLLTIREHMGARRWQDLTVAYVGDGNNMAHSWIDAALALGFHLRVACPSGYGIAPDYLKKSRRVAHIHCGEDPARAVVGAHAVTTDTWFSMGQEVSQEKRQAFAPFQVNEALMAKADSAAVFLHCLPAHRGEEVSDAVIDGPRSLVFDEAENRLHVQKAVLVTLSGAADGPGK